MDSLTQENDSPAQLTLEQSRNLYSNHHVSNREMFNSGMDLLSHASTVSCILYFNAVQRHNLDTSIGYKNDSAAESGEIFQPEEVFPMKMLQLETINQPKTDN